MALYRKLPVEVEAIRWDGDITTMHAVVALAGGNDLRMDQLGRLIIPTMEGDMTAERGDYIIRGVKGEIYPCKPDIFRETYEPV